jgi:hypothetical protein
MCANESIDDPTLAEHLMFVHGADCPKVEHIGEGYLHGADDDKLYEVDGVVHCGRCHGWMGTRGIYVPKVTSENQTESPVTDDPVMIECPDCEGQGRVVVDMRWRPARYGDRWDDVWDACWHCEGTGKVTEGKKA